VDEEYSHNHFDFGRPSPETCKACRQDEPQQQAEAAERDERLKGWQARINASVLDGTYPEVRAEVRAEYLAWREAGGE